MEQTIIELMRKELYDTHLCQQDFEKYDVNSISKSNEPFFWLVRHYGTSLCYVGAERMRQLFASESARMEIMRDQLAVISNIYYWNDDTNKYFYWSGYELCKIEKNDVLTIFQNLWSHSIANLIEEYPEEFATANKPLLLSMSPEISETVEEVKRIAQELNDSSFEDCLNRLQRWRRHAIDHKIKVYGDFAENSFGFSEVINGAYGICGGIIYHSNAKENRWHIHT